MAFDHPYHTLPQLLALKNAFADESPAAQAKLRDDRVRGAEALLSKISKTKTKSILSEMLDMFEGRLKLIKQKLLILITF